MSEEQLHRLVFRGDILIGFDKAKARANLGRLLRVKDTRRMALLFSGKPVVIKKKLTASQVGKYQATLERSGILVSVEPPLVVRKPEASPAFAIDEEALEAREKAAAERQSGWRQPPRARAANTVNISPVKAKPEAPKGSAPTISASFTGLSFSPVQGTRPRPQPQPKPEPGKPAPPLSAESAAVLSAIHQNDEVKDSKSDTGSISPQPEKKTGKGLQWGIASIFLAVTGILGWLAWNFYTNEAMLLSEQEPIVEDIQIPQLSEFERSLQNIEDPELREELRELQAELQRLDQDIQ